jgi:hypothetical protein
MDAIGQEAESLLNGAEHTRHVVAAHTPQEYVHFFGWGLFLALIVPGFDLFDRTIWGWVTLAVAAAGFLFTGVYYALRDRQVRTVDRTPSWVWVALTAWVSGAGVLSMALDDALAVSYLLGGVLAAVPLLVWAERLRRLA